MAFFGRIAHKDLVVHLVALKARVSALSLRVGQILAFAKN